MIIKWFQEPKKYELWIMNNANNILILNNYLYLKKKNNIVM